MPVLSALPPRDLRSLLAPFLGLAEECIALIGTVTGVFESGGRRYALPRFFYVGSHGTEAARRLGLFALLQGDAPAGALALFRLLQTLAARPELAAGCDLAIYPICNPTGFEAGTRENRNGRDLTREFWRSSAEPEVRLLESELRGNAFDGLILLENENAPELAAPGGEGRSGAAAVWKSPSPSTDFLPGRFAPAPEQTPRPWLRRLSLSRFHSIEEQASEAHAALLALLSDPSGAREKGGTLA